MKRRIVLPVLTGIAYFCLFLMAAKYDMPLSKHLTARQISAVVLTGARIGPLPVFFTPAWCLRALFPKPQKQILFRLIEAALCITCGWNLIEPKTFILSEILSVAGASLLFYGLLEILPLPELTERRRKLLWLGIVITTGAFLSVQLMKCIWGRPRFIAILQEGASFREWFHIAGFAFRKDFYRSFPSGHTVSAAAMFFITFLPDLFPDLPQKPWIYWTISFLFTVFVAFSRIMAGMHFISDVMAAFGVYMIWYLVLTIRFQITEERNEGKE
jgi:membrane-associated phospholipid phosphatase